MPIRHVRRGFAALVVCLAMVGLLVAPGVAPPSADAAVSSLPVSKIKRLSIPTATRQVIVVTSASWRTSYGVVELFERNRSGTWVRKRRMAARVGANGMVVGTERKQGTYTTPAGRYRITESFGIAKNPGAKLRYTKVDRRHWWVEEKTSRYYNQMRRSTQGGFRRNHSLSEHLIDYGKQYKYAAVIDFNRPKPVRGRGAGIFLHVNGPRATAGCVSVSERNMKAIMRWLDPKKKPVIVMGPRSWLATQ